MPRYSENDIGGVTRASKSLVKKRKFPALSTKDGGVLAKYRPYIKAMIDRGIKSSMELKREIFNVDFTLAATPGAMNNIFTNLTQGTGRRNRIGNAIRIVGLYGRWVFKTQADSATYGSQTIRSSIVRSKAGVLVASTEGPMDVNGNVSAERGAWDVNTVAILYDNTGYLNTFNSTNPGSGTFGGLMREEFSCKLNTVVTFEQPDSHVVPALNGLFFYICAGSIASPLNAPTVSGFMHYEYYDA